MLILIVRMFLDKEIAVDKWLLMVVTQVEKEIGSGNGQKKLQKVYGMFTERFPVFSVFISFETFSRWVDIALDSMRTLLATEEALGIRGVVPEYAKENDDEKD